MTDDMIRLVAEALLEDDDLIELPSGSAGHAARVAIQALEQAGYRIALIDGQETP